MTDNNKPCPNPQTGETTLTGRIGKVRDRLADFSRDNPLSDSLVIAGLAVSTIASAALSPGPLTAFFAAATATALSKSPDLAVNSKDNNGKGLLEDFMVISLLSGVSAIYNAEMQNDRSTEPQQTSAVTHPVSNSNQNSHHHLCATLTCE